MAKYCHWRRVVSLTQYEYEYRIVLIISPWVIFLTSALNRVWAYNTSWAYNTYYAQSREFHTHCTPPSLPSQVTCNSVDPSLNPVKGRISYNARQQRAEFIPNNTLFPNAQYTVVLLGRAVTTKTCPHSANIKNAELRFHTCSPAPKQIGIKLKGHGDEVCHPLDRCIE